MFLSALLCWLRLVPMCNSSALLRVDFVPYMHFEYTIFLGPRPPPFPPCQCIPAPPPNMKKQAKMTRAHTCDMVWQRTCYISNCVIAKYWHFASTTCH